MTEWGNIRIAGPYDDSPDAESAAEDELMQVINEQTIPTPTPIKQERFNPNLPYGEKILELDTNDQILLEAIKRAVKNGWEGWHGWVNDATTIGLEAEAVIRFMKKFNKSAKELLFDQEFCSYLFGEFWQAKLQQMVIQQDIMQWLKQYLQS